MPQAAPTCDRASDGTLPSWVPDAARSYLVHVYSGASIRQIAREEGCHASTILRQVRKIETARDDPLKDEALESLSVSLKPPANDYKTETAMPQASSKPMSVCDDETIEREAKRILRRLCESKAFLLVSAELPKAAVFREAVPGRKTRTAVVDREVAQAFALNDWIEGAQAGKVGKYRITQTGKAALKRILASDRNLNNAHRDQEDPFRAQHHIDGVRNISEEGKQRQLRCNLAESPLTVLARKKAPDGTQYLTPAMLDAGERLREDFEIAQISPRVTQNWDNFLTASSRGTYTSADGRLDGPAEAREKVAQALKALGPGLGDIAFRCCCFLEGLETAEKRLGWSARAGKVVLRIALQRLADHYETLGDNRMIGGSETRDRTGTM